MVYIQLLVTTMEQETHKTKIHYVSYHGQVNFIATKSL